MAARSRALPPDLAVFHDSTRAAVAVWKNLLITVWRADVAVADVSTTEAAQRHLISRYPVFGSLAVAEQGALRMSSDAQQEAARITRLGQEQLRGVALILGASGFTGAVVRAAVTAVQLASRSSTPHRVFQLVEPGLGWLLDQLGGAPDAEMVAHGSELVAQLRVVPGSKADVDPLDVGSPR